MSKTGVILINVGTPTDPSQKSVGRYLREFLTDRRMINLPKWLRYPLVYGLIVPLRAKNSAKNYQAIWDPKSGSPLLYYSQQCQIALQAALGEDFKVTLGMRYGKPTIESALEPLLQSDCEKLVVLPMFPQYASATTGSAVEQVLDFIKRKINIPNIEIISDFFSSEGYIHALGQTIAPMLAQHQPEKILLSYHGLPVKQIKASEESTPIACLKGLPCPKVGRTNRFCYRAQCYATTQELASELGLPQSMLETAFQSRVGPVAWIEPEFTSKLHELAGQGVKRILVACPSFVSDCLETVEEIGIQGRKTWLELGGESFEMVPCLNDHPAWIEYLQGKIVRCTSKEFEENYIFKAS